MGTKLILRPTSDDSITNNSCLQSEGSTYFECANGETPYVTKYIKGMAQSPLAMLKFPAHGLADGTTINSVKICADVGNTTGNVLVYMRITSGSPVLMGDTGIAPTAFQVCSYESATNPLNGGSVWDVAGLNMILSAGILFPSAGSGNPSKCDQLYMEIDYEGGGGGGGGAPANTSNFFFGGG